MKLENVIYIDKVQSFLEGKIEKLGEEVNK